MLFCVEDQKLNLSRYADLLLLELKILLFKLRAIGTQGDLYPCFQVLDLSILGLCISGDFFHLSPHSANLLILLSVVRL